MNRSRNILATPSLRPHNDLAQLSPYTPRVLRTPFEGRAPLTPCMSAPSAPARERGTVVVPPLAGRSRGRDLTVPMPGLSPATGTGVGVINFRFEPEGAR